MTCPSCDGPTRVLESRRGDDGASVRRRRSCSRCGRRFTTRERRERLPLHVRKRDGTRQPFDRAKLRAGLLHAAHKRPIAVGELDRLIGEIEDEAEEAGGELAASRIGELCLARLRELDRVSYLQFAAVYRGFSDPGEFTEELRRMGLEPTAGPPSGTPQFASAHGRGSV